MTRPHRRQPATLRLTTLAVIGLCLLPAGCATTPTGITAHIGTTTDTRLTVIRAAADALGKPYRSGAGGPGAFSDNGLVHYAYARAGIKLPSAPYALLGAGTPIPMTRAEPGDLVFYQTQTAGGADSLRVGLYLNDGEMLYASAREGKVVIQSIDSGYWSQRLLSVVQILP